MGEVGIIFRRHTAHSIPRFVRDLFVFVKTGAFRADGTVMALCP